MTLRLLSRDEAESTGHRNGNMSNVLVVAQFGASGMALLP
jgi:hypothetical protein